MDPDRIERLDDFWLRYIYWHPLNKNGGVEIRLKGTGGRTVPISMQGVKEYHLEEINRFREAEAVERMARLAREAAAAKKRLEEERKGSHGH